MTFVILDLDLDVLLLFSFCSYPCNFRFENSAFCVSEHVPETIRCSHLKGHELTKESIFHKVLPHENLTEVGTHFQAAGIKVLWTSMMPIYMSVIFLALWVANPPKCHHQKRQQIPLARPIGFCCLGVVW